MRTPITMEAIQALCDRIVAVCDPDKIILFGSWAYGTPTPDSDVDLLVVLEFEKSHRRTAVDILIEVDPPFHVDLLVRRPEELEHRLEIGDPFMKTIVNEGRVIYERTRLRVA